MSRSATLISFGFLLNGPGDVWLYDPKIEAVPANDPQDRWNKGDIFVIGSDAGRLWLCDPKCASGG